MDILHRTLFTNGHVYTMDRSVPAATALVVQGETVLAVGSEDNLASLVGVGDTMVDLEGQTVLPGFTDAHLHLHWYAQTRRWVNLQGVSSLEEVLACVAARAAETPAGDWVIGRGWNQNLWPGRAFPTAADLERVASQHPVYLIAQSGHAGWCNRLALRLAGITAERPDPPGGHIQRDKTGSPTGLLLEEAMELMQEVIGEPPASEAAEAMRQSFPSLWECGITGVHCMDGGPAFEALQLLHQDGGLQLRVLKYLPREHLDAALRLGLRSGFGDDRLRVGGIKLFVDGALGVRTAALLEPYEGEPENRGILTLEQEELFELGQKASAGGLSLAIHAIGDRANRMVMDLYQTLTPPRAIPHRIEHVQLLDRADLGRLEALNITASMQPIHATSDMEMAGRNWGERTRTAYAFRTLLERGTRLVFGSDAPVESPAPLLGIHAAVTRRRRDGSPGVDGWHPEQRLTVGQAVAGFTREPALAAGSGPRLGTLTPGKLADLIVLDQDIFQVDAMEIPSTRVTGTMIGGEWVLPLDR